MIKYRNIAFLLCIGLVLTSCEDNIDLDLDNGKIQLVVDGFIDSDSKVQTIKLSQSAPYFFNKET